MTDTQTDVQSAETAAPSPAITERVVKINGQRITLDGNILNLPLDQLQKKLRTLGYPEVAEAQQRVKVEGGIEWVEYLPRAGRKG